MKKIFIAMAAIFTMLLSIASPIMVKPIKASAANVSYNNLSSPCEDVFQDYLGSSSQPYWHPSTDNSLTLDSNAKVLYLAAKQSRNGSPCDTLGLILAFNNADYSFENGVITLDNVIQTNQDSGFYKIVTYYWGGTRIDYWGNNSFKSAVIDLNNKSVILYADNGFSGNHQDEWYIQGNNTVINEFWDIESNIADLVPATLNVFVSFSPTLSGNVDRSINNNGVQSMRSQLYMQVVNQSRFAIQYKMAIYKKHQDTSRSFDLTVSDNIFYDSDPIFVYYSDSWVYCTNCDSESTFLNSDTVKENKSCPWHYLEASSQDIVTFDFSQINLLEGEEYTVYVYAVANDYGYASEQIVYLASSDPAYSDLKQIQGDDIETVYQSDFVMINYNDVKYDPNNSNNGVKPFNGRDGFAATQQYSYSRNARENQDGSIDYSSRNLYTNQNSWLSQQRSNALANHSTYNSSSVPASLNNHFNGFFDFVNSIFAHLPKDIQSIYIYGFSALIVLAIILKVVK